MAWTATISNPYYVYTGGVSGVSLDVPVAGGSYEKTTEMADELHLYIDVNVLALYDDETNVLNPLTLFSHVVLTRNAQRHFEGYVVEKPTIEEFAEGNYVHVTVVDKAAVLQRTLVCDAAGNYTLVVESTPWDLNAMPLQESTDWHSDADVMIYSLWPDPQGVDGSGNSGINCYVDGATDTVAIATGVADPTAAVTLTGTFSGFQPNGWVVFDEGGANEEWCYFDGYDEAGGQLFNLDRAQLGVGPAFNHAPGTTVTEKIPKQIALGTSVKLENGAGRINTGSYDTDAQAGCVGYRHDATFGANPIGTYSIYDEDGSLGGTPADVADVFTTICTAPAAYGGAGFLAADLQFLLGRASVPALGLAVSRWDQDPMNGSRTADEAIRALLVAVQLQDELLFYYDHTNDRVTLELAYQVAVGAADITLPHAERIEKERSIADLYNGLLVLYRGETRFNKLTLNKAWHDTAAAEGIDSWKYDDDAYPYQYSDPTGEYVGNGNVGMGRMFDMDLRSKFFGKKTGGGNPSFVLAYLWFGEGAVPPTVTPEEFGIQLGNYGGTGTWSFVVEAATDFTTVGYTSPGNTWRPLAAKLDQTVQAQGNTPAIFTATVSENEFARKQLNCIRVKFLSCPQFNQDYQGIVHDMYMVANENDDRYLYIQTDPVTDNGGTLLGVAAATHQKLRGCNARLPARADILDVGPATEGAALYLGRIALRQRLIWYQQRFYRHEGALAVVPEVGMTIAVDEDGDGVADYVGLLKGYRCEFTSREVVHQFRLLDHNAVNIT